MLTSTCLPDSKEFAVKGKCEQNWLKKAVLWDYSRNLEEQLTMHHSDRAHRLRWLAAMPEVSTRKE